MPGQCYIDQMNPTCSADTIKGNVDYRVGKLS